MILRSIKEKKPLEQVEKEAFFAKERFLTEHMPGYKPAEVPERFRDKEEAPPAPIDLDPASSGANLPPAEVIKVRNTVLAHQRKQELKELSGIELNRQRDPHGLERAKREKALEEQGK